MPAYTRVNEVKLRLQGKVRFTLDPSNNDFMQEGLLVRLINEAEAQVELDLSRRYATPFIGCDGTWESVPERPTKFYIRTMCELVSVVRVLETDFGTGTAVDAAKYTELTTKRYEEMLNRLMRRRGGGKETDSEMTNQWYTPPLPGLTLAYHNAAADDGYLGMVINSSTFGQSGSYPAKQVNDPSQTFFTTLINPNGVITKIE